jgi:hypothetical protein
VNNIGLPPGTMPRQLNVSPPGKRPEREPFKVNQDSVLRMIGRILKGIDDRTIPVTRAALEVRNKLIKANPSLFAHARQLAEDAASPPPPTQPATVPPPRPVEPTEPAPKPLPRFPAR